MPQINTRGISGVNCQHRNPCSCTTTLIPSWAIKNGGAMEFSRATYYPQMDQLEWSFHGQSREVEYRDFLRPADNHLYIQISKHRSGFLRAAIIRMQPRSLRISSVSIFQGSCLDRLQPYIIHLHRKSCHMQVWHACLCSHPSCVRLRLLVRPHTVLQICMQWKAGIRRTSWNVPQMVGPCPTLSAYQFNLSFRKRDSKLGLKAYSNDFNEQYLQW